MKRMIAVVALLASVVLTSSGLAQTPVVGRYVRVAIAKPRAVLMLAEVQVFSGGTNVALKGIATQVRDGYGRPARGAIDNNTAGTYNSVSATDPTEPNPWWEVDLQKELPIDRIVVWNAAERPDRLNGCSVMILGADRLVKWERMLPTPSPTDTTLIVDAARSSAAVGKEVPRRALPEQLTAAYDRRATWIETVLATQAKLEALNLKDFGNLELIAGTLMKDFPAQRHEIAEEFFDTLIYKAKVSQPSELASRYASHLRPPQSDLLKPQVEGVKSLAELSAVRQAFREERQLMRHTASMLSAFDAVALERAIRAYAAKYPRSYPDKDALIARVASLSKAVTTASSNRSTVEARIECARQVAELYDAVYMKHPAVDFQELLFVRRFTGSVHDGLPANWQGNSSIPLHGYVNDLVRAPLKPDGRLPQVIFASEAFVGDVDLDFDADKIMYSSGREGEKRWSVFETPLNAPGTFREVTPSDQPDIDYYDPCYLPDGCRIFVATSGFQGVPCVFGNDYVGNLHSMGADGTIRRLVFDQDNSWCPTVMANGRILYLRWEYADTPHYFSRVLMSMNPDGTDQRAVYGSNSYWPNSIFYARPLPGSSSQFIGIVSGHHGHARKGLLTLFDTGRGRHESSGAVQCIPGYGKPVENVTRDTLANSHFPLFLHPYPLDEDLYLVSMLRRDGLFSIVLADRYDNMVPLWQSPADNLFEPIPLKKRPRPPLPADRTVKDAKECTIYMVGAHLGEGLRGVPPGKVRSLRVFQYEYSPRNCGGPNLVGFEGPWDPRTILGTVNVESDGSCLFTAPANVPYWGTWTEFVTGRKDWNERWRDRTKKVLARRCEMAMKYANEDFDPEKTASSYQAGQFTMPRPDPVPAPVPAVKGWPFDAATAKARQGSEASMTVDLGDGQRLTFARIPAGSFAMGSNEETPAEQPVHEVAIGQPFWMAVTEITSAQYKLFDKTHDNGVYDMHSVNQNRRGYYMDNDREFAQPGCQQFPVARVSWEEAGAYCQWLSKQLGKAMRLPTEAQWEWACRAGSSTAMNYGDLNADFSKQENLADYKLIELAISGIIPQPMKDPPPLYDYELRDRRFNDGVLHLAKVGSYAPNAWGLHDMHGNVAEWTRSAYRPYPYSDADGRNNTAVDERKVVRGGSWYRRPHRATSSWRWGYPGWMKPFDVGFRIVIEE